ncbi:MAG: mitochondrial fission ELM1 family protein [Candidatus Omnitrophota bacterium]|nr:MAG: mitochondrial fission ELM1 family protein [Candidatus Omnitrophota bacterium]
MYLLRKVLMKSPLVIPLSLGNLIGIMLYMNKKRRRVSFQNIKLAFPEKSNSEIKSILKKSFLNFGISLMETLIAPRLSQHLKIMGDENLPEEGGILVGVHFGSWEFYQFCLAKLVPLVVFARVQKNRPLDKFLNEIRNEEKLHTAFSIKELIKFVKKNFQVGLVVDHGAKDDATLVEFFSQLVPTPKGAVFIAKKFSKKIYPCFGHRKRGFKHILKIGEAIDPRGKSEEEILKTINGFYEKVIKNHPENYLWYFKRFKRKKTRDIIILSDNKPGHLKQSQALLSYLKEENNYKIRSKIIELEYKNRLARMFAEACAYTAGDCCVGCGQCLHWVLKNKPLQELKKSFADIIISTGSITAPINKIFSSYLGAKSAVILKPNLSLKKFDLAIIPEHDRICDPNAIKIKGALVYQDKIDEKIIECKNFFKLTNEKKIAFFLGGAQKNEKEFMEKLALFIKQLKNFAIKNNYRILISTSRRTKAPAEELVEKELGGLTNTEAIVYANRTNYDFVFEGFAEISEIVFVTSESISMISEVLALKKPCVCAILESQYGKHEIFLDSLKDDITLLNEPFNIDKMDQRESKVFEENRKKIKEAIGKLL